MKILIGTLIVVAVLSAVLALYAQHLKRSGMFFPEVYPRGNWTIEYSIKPEEFYFDTPDGVRLHAWLFRALDPNAPLIIYFHGNAGHLAYRAPFASELAARGVSVFLFDYRGYGRSVGRPSEKALHTDSLAAYEFARATLRTDPSRIVLYGESIGAPYAARVAIQRPACCVVVENSFSSLRSVANALFRPLPMGFFAGELLPTRQWLDEAGRPVLVMHGKRDHVVPFRVGMELYKELSVEKELFVSEEAGHAELQFEEGDRFYETVLQFIHKHANR